MHTQLTILQQASASHMKFEDLSPKQKEDTIDILKFHLSQSEWRLPMDVAMQPFMWEYNQEVFAALQAATWEQKRRDPASGLSELERSIPSLLMLDPAGDIVEFFDQECFDSVKVCLGWRDLHAFGAVDASRESFVANAQAWASAKPMAALRVGYKEKLAVPVSINQVCSLAAVYHTYY